MSFTDFFDFSDISREAIKLSTDDQLYIRIYLKSLFQSYGIHVPGFAFGVDEDRNAAFVDNRIQCRIEGHVRAENSLAFNCSVTDSRLSVELLPSKLYAQMKCGSTAGKTDSVFYLCLFGSYLLHLVDVCSDGGHPVGFIRFGYVFQFIAVHGRA